MPLGLGGMGGETDPRFAKQLNFHRFNEKQKWTMHPFLPSSKIVAKNNCFHVYLARITKIDVKIWVSRKYNPKYVLESVEQEPPNFDPNFT